jgi:hypothetical protein
VRMHQTDRLPEIEATVEALRRQLTSDE